MSTYTIQGNIFAPDILEQLSQGEIKGQSPSDFGLDGPVREEIQLAYSIAKNQWQNFQLQLERKQKQHKLSDTATSETRSLWLIPFFQILGYEVERGKTEEILGKTFAISHRVKNRGQVPVHLVGVNDELDKKRPVGGTRLSPHALVQEYLNLHEHLYGLVSNGKQLRLLRDSGQLVRLTYLEFNLEEMMEGDHLAEFGLLYRLLHPSRLPSEASGGEDCLLEFYHQESLDAGARIRDGLSESVEQSLRELGQAFLGHPDNEALRQAIAREGLDANDYYQELLRLIYRLLFLFVIEERNLVYPEGSDPIKKQIYYDYYSLTRLRLLSEKRYLADQQHSDLWVALRQTFRLFRAAKYGAALDLKPLNGGLFGPDSLRYLEAAQLDNETLLRVIRRLNLFRHPETGQLIRVNYGALNVEEFGSVYENLLELGPVLEKREVSGESQAAEQAEDARYAFTFTAGQDRSSSGSHYTPDELVKPLIEHSLDHVIEERREARGEKREKEAALLSLRVCDVACGSGHILLAAARRIGLALAQLRTGEQQPGPGPLGEAVRDVIRHCIYGVDKNPLAVELCKVALWLEAHQPGEPLSFLDHRIKCGDAIVGLARLDELQRGIPDEAFKTLPGDDKAVAAALRKRNKQERKQAHQQRLRFEGEQTRLVGTLAQKLAELDRMPERTPEEVQAKAEAYEQVFSGPTYLRLRTLADVQVAQFFLPKTEGKGSHLTDAAYRDLLTGHQALMGRPAVAQAQAEGMRRNFFHWFLEFPEVFARPRSGVRAGAVQTGLFGHDPKPQLALDTASAPAADEVSPRLGFDVVLGNPPFLGGLKLSTYYGSAYLNFLHSHYPGAKGTTDLVAYFFRRIHGLLREKGFQALISTNTIAQGDTREGGLSHLLEQGASINFAIPSMRWPGLAAVEVALLALHKGPWSGTFWLRSKPVERITSYLDDSEVLGDPEKLKANENLSFIGSYVLGKGFVLTPEQAQHLLQRDPRHAEVIYPYLNGSDLNGEPDGSPTRYVINFHDWPLRRMTEAEWEDLSPEEAEEIKAKREKGRALVLAPPDYTAPVAADYPACLEIVEREVKPERMKQKREIRQRFWWKFGETTPALYRSIAPLERVLVVPLVSKFSTFCFVENGLVYMHKLGVLALQEWSHFTILGSSIHHHWAWRYSSTLGSSTLNYSPSNCFETFPFPRPTPAQEAKLAEIGARYHAHRRGLLLSLQVGLTKLYNQVHNEALRGEKREARGEIREGEPAQADRAEAEALATQLLALSDAEVKAQYGKATHELLKQVAQIAGTTYVPRDMGALLRGEAIASGEPVPAATLAEAIWGIWLLRRLHVEMDEAVLAAYGWGTPRTDARQGVGDPNVLPDVPTTVTDPIALRHGFHPVDYLPENDRIRFTIHPEARKEVLRRLLLLNHARYAEEVKQGLHGKGKGAAQKKPQRDEKGTLFG